MKAKRRGIRRYRCWLCGKDLEITTPPYLRNDNCHCEEEGLPGGSCVPYGMTEEQIEHARREYARIHGE